MLVNEIRTGQEFDETSKGGFEYKLGQSVNLTEIPTSRPKGRVPEKRPVMMKEIKIESVVKTEASKTIAKKIEVSLRELLPKGLSNDGIPETLEDLRDMACKKESIVDELMKDGKTTITDPELDLLTLMSVIAEYIRRIERGNTLGGNEEEKIKIESVKFQQEMFKTIFQFYSLENDFGQFNQLISTIFSISETYLNGKKGRVDSRSLVSKHGYIDGVRGMLTTAILLKKAGLEVYLPNPIDDVCRGCDLVTEIEGQKVAISIKARLKSLTETDTNPLSAKLSFVTNSEFCNARYLFLEIPNIYNETTIRKDEFYGPKMSSFPMEAVIEIGLPSELATEWMKREIALVRERIKVK